LYRSTREHGQGCTAGSYDIHDVGDFAVDYAQLHHGGTKFDNREDSDLCAIYHFSNDIDANFDGRGAFFTDLSSAKYFKDSKIVVFWYNPRSSGR